MVASKDRSIFQGSIQGMRLVFQSPWLSGAKKMDVSKNRGTPKWMVDSGKPYEQMDDLGIFGGFPIFLETPIII